MSFLSFFKSLFKANTPVPKEEFVWQELTYDEESLLEGNFLTKDNPIGIDPLKWVDATWGSRERQLVIAYLKTTEPKGIRLGTIWCNFRCKQSIWGPHSYENSKFAWSSVFVHWVEKHHVKPPQQVIDYIIFLFSKNDATVVQKFLDMPITSLSEEAILSQKTYQTAGVKGSLWIIPTENSKVAPELVKALRTLPPLSALSSKEMLDILRAQNKQRICTPCDFADLKEIDIVAKKYNFQFKFQE